MQKNTTRLLGAMLMAVAMADVAFAGAANLAPVTDIAEDIAEFMTGALARTVGIIAIAFVGYRWFTGRLELGKAMTIAGGIVLVLGAPAIVDFISDASQTAI